MSECCSCLTERLTLIVSGRSARHAAPGCALAWRQPSRSTQRPIGTIRPISSASGMNSSGPTRPRSGWRQRSSASTPGDGAVVEADDRLVVQLELVGGDRALQVGAQLQAREHALVHRRLEQAVAALAVALGDVHRGVGVADELVGVGGDLALDDRDAEAASGRRAPSGPAAAAPERLEDRARRCRPPPAR